MHYVSLTEMLGLNLSAAWTLFWTLFCVRLILGFAVGLDGVALRLRRPPPNAKVARQTEDDARTLRRGDNIVAVLHVALLVMFALVWPFVPAQ